MMVPLTFEEWKDCMVNDCKIDLTREFADKRLTVLENRADRETEKFVSLYGEEHLKNIKIC